jgi:hypothetical protein
MFTSKENSQKGYIINQHNNDDNISDRSQPFKLTHIEPSKHPKKTVKIQDDKPLTESQRDDDKKS